MKIKNRIPSYLNEFFVVAILDDMVLPPFWPSHLMPFSHCTTLWSIWNSVERGGMCVGISASRQIYRTSDYAQLVRQYCLKSSNQLERGLALNISLCPPMQTKSNYQQSTQF